MGHVSTAAAAARPGRKVGSHVEQGEGIGQTPGGTLGKTGKTSRQNFLRGDAPHRPRPDSLLR